MWEGPEWNDKDLRKNEKARDWETELQTGTDGGSEDANSVLEQMEQFVKWWEKRCDSP